MASFRTVTIWDCINNFHYWKLLTWWWVNVTRYFSSLEYVFCETRLTKLTNHTAIMTVLQWRTIVLIVTLITKRKGSPKLLLPYSTFKSSLERSLVCLISKYYWHQRNEKLILCYFKTRRSRNGRIYPLSLLLTSVSHLFNIIDQFS